MQTKCCSFYQKKLLEYQYEHITETAWPQALVGLVKDGGIKKFQVSQANTISRHKINNIDTQKKYIVVLKI